jgi:hypothetical protein
MKFKPGDKVRINRKARVRMFWSKIIYANLKQGNYSHRKHIQEFRRSIGIVQGFIDFNNVSKDHPDYDPDKVGPEIDVIWDGKLRYAYNEDDLEKI